MSFSVDGLFSGLDTTNIINQLVSIAERPIRDLKLRVENTTKEKTAFLDISARLLALKTRAAKLADAKTFSATSTTSASPSVLKATGSQVTSPGSYVFRPARLATAQQFLSRGFADIDTTPVGAGTLEITAGGGFVVPDRALTELNGGAGVASGRIRITDRAGNSAEIDLSGAATVEDVLETINSSGRVSVTASANNDFFVLTDTSGGAGNLRVEEIGSTTARDLGILANFAGSVFVGNDVSNIAGNTSLMALNDGNGTRRVVGNDFRITLRDGTILNIDLDAQSRVQEVLDSINNHASNGGKLTARISGDGNRLELVDNTGVSGTLSVTSLSGSLAAKDLGILGSVTGAGVTETLSGTRVSAPLASVLLSDVRGGSGVNLGTISLTDRSGASTTVNVTGMETLEEVVNALDGAVGVSISARINDEGNGILVTDGTGLTASNLIITDVSGAAAANLGISTGGAGVAANQVNGTSVRLRYVSLETRLADMNFGRGARQGKLEIIDSNGTRATIDLTQSDDTSVEDVIEEINGAFVSVNARINDNGDGILLEDTGGGGSKMVVRDLPGSTIAKELRITGEAPDIGASNRIDGSHTGSITISATDKLKDVQTKINALGLPVSAGILNTGAATNPYRLTLTSTVAGARGRFLVDPGSTSFSFEETAEAGDSVLLFGAGTSPVRLTSNKNSYADVVEGLTVDMLATSAAPVTVTVDLDRDGLLKQVKSFVENFNTVVDKIDDLTKFNTETNAKGLLFGDSTLRSMRNNLQRLLIDPASGLTGRYRTLSQVGVSTLDDGTVVLDEAEFLTALEEDPGSVRELFTDSTYGFGKRFDDALKALTDVKDGQITRATTVRDDIIASLKKRIEVLSKRVEAKRKSLKLEFARMEEAFRESQSVISRLGQAFGALQSGGGGGGLAGIGG